LKGEPAAPARGAPPPGEEPLPEPVQGDNRGGSALPLDKLETLFAEQYRREIDQEENVWRSLPFFSATLAVEVAILSQAAPLLLASSGGLALTVAMIGCLLALLILAVLHALFRSIRSQPFSYLSSESELLDYVRRLELVVEPNDAETEARISGLLQEQLIEQYRAANEANRRINQRRSQARARAGVLLLASIIATLALVGVSLAPQIRDLAILGGLRGEGAGRPTASSPASSTAVPSGGAARQEGDGRP
jgi:hypothetical protein